MTFAKEGDSWRLVATRSEDGCLELLTVSLLLFLCLDFHSLVVTRVGCARTSVCQAASNLYKL